MAVTAAAAVGCSLWLVGGYRMEEDQMTAWQAEPATGQGGRCLSDVARGGDGELMSLELLDYVARP